MRVALISDLHGTLDARAQAAQVQVPGFPMAGFLARECSR